MSEHVGFYTMDLRGRPNFAGRTRRFNFPPMALEGHRARTADPPKPVYNARVTPGMATG